MSGIQTPYSSWSPATIDQASLTSLEKKSIQTNLFGGFTEDGSKAWMVRGPVLEVVSRSNGDRVSCHHFDVATEDPTIHITSVKEFVFRGVEAFLLGLRSDGGKGLVCVYEIGIGKVLMAVKMPYGVTSLDIITEVGGIDAPNFCLSQQMQKFFGIAAIGTDRGHFYLLDLRVDENHISSEKFPREAKIVTLETQYIENLRLSASNKGQHLCLEMNSNAHSYFAFRYLRPDNESLRDYSPDDVFVSNITYLSHTGTLAVGFNFGCFQLWQLAEAVLEYSSPVSPQVTPVTYFASQEPTDDPQFFCYLWIGRGPLPWESSQDVPTDVHLFQLSYEEKTYHGSHGHLFRELNNCCPRFSHNLTHDPYLSDEDLSLGSRLISCWCLEKILSREEEKETIGDEDEDYTPMDRTLTAFVWEGRPETVDGQLESNYFLAIFDLNQWYYAQMPAKIRHSQADKSPCKYFAFYSLDSIQEMCAPDFLLNLHIDPAGISRYQSTTPAVLELHQQPTALSFNATFLTETALIDTRILGLQKKVLAEMSSQGPMILREPVSVFNRCCDAQLLTRSGHPDDGRLTLERQREAILTVALRNDQLSFILQCIYNWSQGDFSAGISLRALMEWAWRQVTNRKQMIDNMCEPLFDGEGTFIDFQTTKRLSQCSKHYHHLISIFKTLLKQSETTTEQGAQDLSTKLVVLSLLNEHLRALLWFVRSGLLPECTDKQGPAQAGQYSYPVTLLRHAYHQRRAQIKKLSGLDSSLLLIDGIVEEAGPDLTALWQRGDETSDGLYPPPSLHALLDIYLMESMPLFTKQCIVGYMMLDIESTLADHKDQQLSEHISKFDSVMMIPIGLTKLVHAFWLLDHRDFTEALNMLLHPMTDTSLSSWQHGSIIRSFLYHGEGQKALQYVRAIRPALSTPDDIKLHLTVLLANGLTSEAFFFQRNYHDDSTSEELLYHLFLGSQQTKTMNQLLQLPFNEREESTLRKYLQETTEPHSQEILVMHLIQRAQFVEATRLNTKLNQQMMMDADAAARESSLTRNIIVKKCEEVMPAVQRKLAFNPEVKRSTTRGTRHEVPRPKPLSTKINPAKTQRVISHALLMTEVLDKIAEARECLKEGEVTPINSPNQPLPDIEPFVGTPITPSSKSRKRYSTTFVYPDPSELNSSSWQPSTASSHLLNHTSRFLSELGTPQSAKQKRRMASNYSGADAMSLLQTPLVQKRTPKRAQLKQPPVATPQSILRVRQVVRRSPSPAKEKPPPLPPPWFGITSADIRLPTPPPNVIRRTLSSRGNDVEEAPKPVAPPTPQKHLRFTEDTKGATPSPLVQTEESSSEPSPEEEEPSTPRGPSPEFGTPPSGSPKRDIEKAEGPVTTFEERLEQGQTIDVATAERELTYDITKRDSKQEDDNVFHDPSTNMTSAGDGLPDQHQGDIIEMGKDSDVEEEFYDVENTEDLVVRSALGKSQLEIPSHIDSSNYPSEDVPKIPPQATEQGDNLEPEKDKSEDLEEIVAVPESPDLASPLAGSGDTSSRDMETEVIKIVDDTLDTDAPMETTVATEKDNAVETGLVTETDNVMETNATGTDQEDAAVFQENVDEESSEVTFNFDLRREQRYEGTDLQDTDSQREQETTGLNEPPSSEPVEESRDTSYSSYDLPRPPIHPLPGHIEEKYGSPPGSSPTKRSPQRSFVMTESHPFPTPPQRTDTGDDGMDEDVASLPLRPLLPHPHQGNVEIQTSPFIDGDHMPTQTAAVSSQTTPGLGLAPRTPGTAQKRAPFNMSLRSHSKHDSNLQQPSPQAQSVEEMQVKPVDQEEPSIVVTEAEPEKPSSPEPSQPEEKAEEEEIVEATGTTAKAALPFIFSPPSTRSKSRRRSEAFLQREVASLLQDSHLDERSLLPAVDSPSGAQTRRGRYSMTPTPTSSPMLLDASLTRTRRGRRSMDPTPTSSPALLDTSLTRSTRRGRRSMTPTASPADMLDASITRSIRSGRRSITPADSPAVVIVDTHQATEEKQSKPEIVTKRVTRSRRGKSLIVVEPSDSPINFISPIKEEEEGARQERPEQQKVKRIPAHSMSLRKSSRTKRTIKLF